MQTVDFSISIFVCCRRHGDEHGLKHGVRTTHQLTTACT